MRVSTVCPPRRTTSPPEVASSVASPCSTMSWTSRVAPMTSVVAATLKQRADIVDDGDMVEDVLANAPEETRNFFVVPKVIE